VSDSKKKTVLGGGGKHRKPGGKEGKRDGWMTEEAHAMVAGRAVTRGEKKINTWAFAVSVHSSCLS
jgi:hypothetical protein